MAANTVTNSISGLSRETSPLAALMSSPMSASGSRSVVLLYSALLTAMKMLADSPLPATSPTSRNSRRSSSRKEIVEIAADLARRHHASPRDRCASRRAAASVARQRRGLDALRRLQLAARCARSARAGAARSARAPSRWRVDSASVSTSSTPKRSSEAERRASPRRTAGAAMRNTRYPAHAEQRRRTRARAARRCAASSAAWPRSAARRAARTASASSHAIRAGRRSKVSSKRFSSSCAWISLPGMRSPSGVFW